MAEKFIGRKEELKALQDKYDKSGFHLAIIYGRRRIGKTTLVNRFVELNDAKAISFVASERTEGELLRRMSEAVLFALNPTLHGNLSFDTFEALFDFVSAAAQKERIIFVIDEYSYLAKACPYMNSVLQKYVDRDWKNTNLFVILLGSLVSFMEEKVLAKDSPLHGRSDLEFKLRPFGYYETSLFVPRFSDEEKAIVYGLTSGVAKYLEQFDDALSLDQNIVNLFFSRTAYFTTEQIKTIISADKNNPTAYNSIIDAIAGGKTKYNEISDESGIKDISFCLKNLISAEIVERREANKPYYIISDNMVRFWFRYVSKGENFINAGKGEFFYYQRVKASLHEYMGPVFEEMAKQFIFSKSGSADIPCFVTDISEFQRSIKKGKDIKNIEIDLLGLDGKKYVMAGECKFRSEPFGKTELDTFLDKVGVLDCGELYLILFSLSGYTSYVEEMAGNIKLVTLEDMYCGF